MNKKHTISLGIGTRYNAYTFGYRISVMCALACMYGAAVWALWDEFTIAGMLGFAGGTFVVAPLVMRLLWATDRAWSQ